MRDETGGVLDHLSPAQFEKTARRAYIDAREWNRIGPVRGVDLADYCRANRIETPAWVQEGATR